MTMWKLAAGIAVTAALIMYLTKRTCTIRCGNGVKKENMTAGLGTINGLALYNNSSTCFGANAMGSSSPFCTTNGYVLT